jgi:hypothetical protein
MLIISIPSFSQLYTHMAIGNTNNYFSHELQVGLRINNSIVSVGYISTLNNSQPALFNIRAGQVITDRWMVFGGYVRNHMSNDYKWKNYNTWQAGAQYHFLHFDKGTFYATGIYTNGSKGRVTMGIGMSYNLFQ